MLFPIVMYGCEGWTIKKAECWRTDAFKPRCWRRLWRVPWTAKRSNKSILKETNTEYSLVEKEMATHSSILAWRIPWMEEPVGLPSMGSHRVRHDWSGLAAAAAFIEGTDAEAEAPILWPPDAKSQLSGKDPDAGKDRRQEEKGMTEDEMVRWHHWLDGHEF